MIATTNPPISAYFTTVLSISHTYTLYASSASSANTIVRSVIAAIFPVVAHTITDNIGTGWDGTFIASHCFDSVLCAHIWCQSPSLVLSLSPSYRFPSYLCDMGPNCVVVLCTRLRSESFPRGCITCRSKKPTILHLIDLVSAILDDSWAAVVIALTESPALSA